MPPRSFPLLCTSSLEWQEQQQSEGVLGRVRIEVPPPGFSPTALSCGLRDGVHLGAEPLEPRTAAVYKESRCQGLFWHCHGNSSSRASCFCHLFADGSARQLIASKLKFAMPVLRLGFRKGRVESCRGLHMGSWWKRFF